MSEKAAERARQVNMSPEGIDRRLKDVGQLYKLGMSLRKARYLGTIDDLRTQEAAKPLRPPRPPREGVG